MGTHTQAIRIGLGALALGTAVAAQEAHFFRIAGPVPTTITAVGADGYITWTNVATNATFTVQTAASLLRESNWVDYVQVPTTNEVTTNRLYDMNPPSGMVLIPAGSFTMGDTFNEGVTNAGLAQELPLHTVYVSAFNLDKNLVSYALWQQVCQWAISHGYGFDTGSGKVANHPVQGVSWYDAVKWCNARSEQEGRVPCYYTNASQSQATIYRSGQFDLATNWVNWVVSGYRLPTEAEWEKAARGGLRGQRFPWGNTIDWSRANYFADPVDYSYDTNPTNGYHPTFKNTAPYTSPVGYFAANGYGLYDMAGNVWEWCWDWYGTYSSGSQNDPRGPSTGSYGSYRVFRGGGWGGNAFYCRTADRGGYDPACGGNCGVGFRAVLPSGQ